ncbi:Lactose transport system permease protein LacF [subsurface metagenome]
MRKLARREAVNCYLFISPWIIGFSVFIIGPMVTSFILSFAQCSIISPAKFVGLNNYIYMFTKDSAFRQSLKVTFIYTMGSVPLNLIGSLGLALLLNQKIPALAWFRTGYYLPAIMTGVPVALLWMWIFNPEYGIMNQLLYIFGIQGPTWLFSTEWVIPAFIIMSFWTIGGSMILYLAGLQGIPTQLYEAAKIDGANKWYSFWKITLPLITPVVFFNLVMSTIGSFQVFTQAFVMTKGGPMNASLLYVLYLYRNAFSYFKMGYACGLAWILFSIILFFTALLFKFSNRWVYYEVK